MSYHNYYNDPYEVERSAVPHDARPDLYYTFFSKNNINNISTEITKRLTGVHPKGKNIIVPDQTIMSVMDSIYINTYRDLDIMTMMTIQYLVDYIKDEFETIEKNNKLNIWITSFRPE